MTLWHDIRFALRLLLKDRWFTAAAVLALALGIGANATVFTLVNAVLIRGLPFKDADRLMQVWTENVKGQRLGGASWEDFEDWRKESRSFSHLIVSLTSNVNVSDDAQPPEQYGGAYVSWNLFDMIGESPQIGRGFQAPDDQAGAAPVVVIGHRVWRNRYASNPNVLGRSIRVNSRVLTVVGVMPPNLRFPENVDVWIPRVWLPPGSYGGRGAHNFQVMGRLAPGVTVEQARAELAGIGRNLAAAYPATNKDARPNLKSINSDTSDGEIRLIFLSMMGAVGFVLLIACANVANLLLGRAIARAREVSIRQSIGATRWRIVRQLLVESIILATIGGAAGFALAIAGVRWFDAATTDVDKPYWMEFTFDPIVFAFVAAICVATAIVFGLAPALQVSKTDINEVLKEGGRTGAAGLRTRRWAGALIVVELVLTIVLLSGGGFMMRSFLSLYRMETGMNTANLIMMELYLPLTKYPQPEPRRELYQRFEDRLAAMPSVTASALTTTPPLGGSVERGLALDGRMPVEGEQPPRVTVVGVGDGYFAATGLGLRVGRAFTREDGPAGHEAVIVNERFVALHSRGQDPIGRRVRLIGGQMDWAQIVGVVPNLRQNGALDPEPDPVVYVPFRTAPERISYLLVRSASSIAGVMPEVREAMRVVEPDLPLFNVHTMDEMLARERWIFVVFGSMFGVFAIIALGLSAVGLYAVSAFAVTQRTQEIGVRMALGAQPRQILWMVLRRTIVQLAIGVPIGLFGAYGVGRLLQGFLVGTTPGDPVTLVGIVIILVGVAVLACLHPARRAASLDPVIALRD